MRAVSSISQLLVFHNAVLSCKPSCQRSQTPSTCWPYFQWWRTPQVLGSEVGEVRFGRFLALLYLRLMKRLRKYQCLLLLYMVLIGGTEKLLRKDFGGAFVLEGREGWLQSLFYLDLDLSFIFSFAAVVGRVLDCISLGVIGFLRSLDINLLLDTRIIFFLLYFDLWNFWVLVDRIYLVIRKPFVDVAQERRVAKGNHLHIFLHFAEWREGRARWFVI